MSLTIDDSSGARSRESDGILADLLSAASDALSSDVVEAKLCIARAAELLRLKHRPVTPQNSAASSHRGGLAAWQSRRIKAYVDAHLNGPLRAADLARLADLSTSHFFRAFRETFGEAPLAYITRRRMHYAQRRMLDTRDPLSQIALDCGHCDQAHFTRVFRRFVGTTPREWRRRNAVGPQLLDALP